MLFIDLCFNGVVEYSLGEEDIFDIMQIVDILCNCYAKHETKLNFTKIASSVPLEPPVRLFFETVQMSW